MTNTFYLKYHGKKHKFVEVPSGDKESFFSYVYRGKKYIGKTNEYSCSIADLGKNVKACDFVTYVNKDAKEPVHNLLSGIFT